jgi:hypothetical protein
VFPRSTLDAALVTRYAGPRPFWQVLRIRFCAGCVGRRNRTDAGWCDNGICDSYVPFIGGVIPCCLLYGCSRFRRRPTRRFSLSCSVCNRAISFMSMTLDCNQMSLKSFVIAVAQSVFVDLLVKALP